MLPKIKKFALTRFEYRFDRSIGDSQVFFENSHSVALELHDDAGNIGLGFGHKLFEPYPSQATMEATFAKYIWPEIEGQTAFELTQRVERPRGGNQRDAKYGFDEALQIALWDLASQQASMPLGKFLGGTREKVRAYASGLDFHMSDEEFVEFFSNAASHGFDTFKVKIGSPDPEWDLHRLELLKKTVGPDCGIMADANEAWSCKEAAMRLTMFHDAGIDLIWIEDPILRNDFAGLRSLREMAPFTQINSGEYLDLTGKRMLLQAGGTDIINVHGRVSDTMRIGWLAADMGLPVSLGNTFLETGVHAACALPEVEWLEYSFLSNEHLVDTPIEFKDGYALLPEKPGIGFALTDAARNIWSAPDPVAADALKTAPPCRFISK
ncbi:MULTISPECIES: mandelate racemase/muconate lactonizing enzyme family protein [Halocynthiibacter]|uniref:Mandelate racemase/muconate lactonizing enzyme family protein n=1 Tax=Halocynthiibacter halioticoli TaxID=2986804 RepID=A0AAE3J1W3_9RHOB|nr:MULTISPECIES: mandelate racemase/muconate lactonizing enzyme family protein [Halocynthiibacter]MCV6825111.1 mandelate racemase/muconate lactonizing enzyme family protein [Halocynthiibacter halioticoli]MCW4058112.1 mandelate racemase/muconate lactonizing enzyme family protein [Halocynthiibacter sp. SDUM655004]